MAIVHYYVDPQSGSDTTGDGSSSTPWASVQHALDNITRNTGTGGDQINVKAGSADVLTASLDLSTYGAPSVTSRLTISGYTSTADDAGLGVIDGNGSYAIIDNIATDAITFKHMHLKDPGTNWLVRLDNDVDVLYCKLSGSTSAGLLDIDSGCRVIGCHFFDSASTGINVVADSIIKDCYFESGPTYNFWYAIILGGAGSSAIGNVITLDQTGGAEGIRCTHQQHNVWNNTVYNDSAGQGNGITSVDSADNGGFIVNNYVEGFSGTGGYGIYAQGGGSTVMHNRYYNNTTHIWVYESRREEDNSSVTASALTNPSSEDFSVGTDLKAEGWPQSFYGSSTNNYLDIGAVQRQEPAGGSNPTGRQGLHPIEAGAI